MARDAAETALADAGFSRPGDGVRAMLADGDQAGLFDAWEGERSLLAETARQKPGCSAFEVLPPHKQRGRPSGALGKATRELVDTLDRLGYKDPLIGAAEVTSTDWQTLARVLGCSVLEAFDRWLRCAEFYAQYKHQKTPVAVSGVGAPVIPIQINLGDGQSVQFMALPDNLRGLAVLPENQGVIEGQAAKVAGSEGSQSAPSR